MEMMVNNLLNVWKNINIQKILVVLFLYVNMGVWIFHAGVIQAEFEPLIPQVEKSTLVSKKVFNQFKKNKTMLIFF